MSTELNQVGPKTDDEVLDFAQATRLRVVDALTVGRVPTDPKEVTVLLQALDGLTRSAMGNKKLGSAENIADADRHAAMVINQINNHYGSRSPFEVGGGGSVIPGHVIDVSKLPAIELAPGETEIGIATMTYDTFIKTVEASPEYAASLK